MNSEQAGVRLQDGEEILLTLKPTGSGVLALSLLTFGFYLLWQQATWFVVTDRRLITKRGVLNKTEVALPLHFIQNTSVHVSWEGIGRVDISTASDEGISHISPLKPQDARQLADTIMAQANHFGL
jgi:membrane protein YdbS with pleckstrin-like domain